MPERYASLRLDDLQRDTSIVTGIDGIATVRVRHHSGWREFYTIPFISLANGNVTAAMIQQCSPEEARAILRAVAIAADYVRVAATGDLLQESLDSSPPGSAYDVTPWT